MSPRQAGWLAGLWLVVIYGTLGVVRPVCAVLRREGFLAYGVTLGAVCGLWVALLALRREGRDQPTVPWLALIACGVGFVVLAGHWGLLEERVHLIEYGVLGVLLGRFLPGRLGVALALGCMAGAADEGIQYLLPERTFDLWDIGANWIAVSATVLLSRGGPASWSGPGLLLGAALVLPQVHTAHGGSLSQASQQPPSGITNDVLGGNDQGRRVPVLQGASVLLVTVDALRRDAVPPWGGGEVALPAFQRMADESVAAAEGFANSIWTTPGIQSLLTGLLPEVHGVQARGEELPLGPKFPLEQLRAGDYLTIGYAGDETETYRNLGFDSELELEGDTTEQTVNILASPGPSLVWLHLRDIHAPYDSTPQRLAELGLPSELPSAPILDRARSKAVVPRRDFPGRHDWLRPAIRSLYLAEVVDADRRLGHLLKRLEDEGLLETCLVILTADHGEELLEHDGIGHASTTLNSAPQPELVHIPFYFRLPGAQRGGATLAGRLEQVDLMPTLFGLIGTALEPVKPGVTFDGEDRSSELLGGPPLGPAPAGPTIISSTPCGWQCPRSRRSERVHARVMERDWDWCRPPQQPCRDELGLALEDQARRAKRLRDE